MKLTLYMAITVNGYIARVNGETPWSDEEWDSFSEKVRKVKYMIVGRKTFDVMCKTGDFDKISDLFMVVVLSKKRVHNNTVFVQSPEEAVAVLEKRGVSEALIAGGGILNASFLKAKLVDEIIVDVEPRVFGQGIRLFVECDFEAELELLSVKKLGENTVQLRYKVITIC